MKSYWTVLHDGPDGRFVEGILESRARARLQKRMCDEDETDPCAHRVLRLFDIRLITAKELMESYAQA